MRYYLSVLVFFLFALFNTSNAQKNISKDLVKKATKALKEEQYNLAEKHYLEANRYYPIPLELFVYANTKMKNNDVKGANRIIDSAISRFSSMDDLSINSFDGLKIPEDLYFGKSITNLKDGDPSIGITSMIKFLSYSNKIENSRKQIIEANVITSSEYSYIFGDRKSLVEIKTLSEKLKLERSILSADIYIKLFDKKYEDAIKMLSNFIENVGAFSDSKVWARRLMPIVLAYAGEYEKSDEAINSIVKKYLFDKEIHYAYPSGLCALGQKNYIKAVEYFTQALQPVIYMGIKMQNPGKFRYYTKRAEAYLGLNEFVKAKKDFDLALTYFPDYEPALNGLAKLEGKIITERRIDKTPPIIVISEPAAARGLKIVGSGKDMMVKGIAADPSGLKSVSINGNIVYSKEEGDFWGVISLSEGKNTIKIIAMDMAGNAAEQVIEIEKPQNAIATNNDIIPVTQKEGRNFILLIASQNYDDQSIPSLDNPIPDAIKLKMVLKNSYNFNEDNIITLFNPERTDFKKRFIELSETLQPEDNLIIFYAGHGIWVEKEKKGYWLLTDAKRSDPNTWLPNKEVLTMISNLSTRHTLLITDACFSGSVFKTRSIGSDAPPAVREMSEKISRVAITSGNDTEVPDQSVFMKYLIKALSENREKFLTAQKMFITQIIEAVMTESKTEPRYGTLELAGHVGGDFIFIKK